MEISNTEIIMIIFTPLRSLKGVADVVQYNRAHFHSISHQVTHRECQTRA